MESTAPARRALSLFVALPVLLAALSGCGSSGASEPAPVISDLSLTPTSVSAGKAATLTGTLTASDADAAVAVSSLDATITLPGGASQALPPTPLQAPPGLAVVTFTLELTPPTAGSYEVAVFVTDTDGKTSNTLSATVDVE